MPTIGSGLASLGEDIGNILVQEHKKHQAYDEALGLADALSRIGIDKRTGAPVQIQYDEKGKIVNGDSIQAFADPKMLDAYRQYNRRNAAQSAGALSALSRIMAAGIARSQSEAIDRSYNVPTTIGGQTFSLSQPQAASVAAQQEAQRQKEARQVPVTIPGTERTVQVSPETAISAGESAERRRLSQEPKGLTLNQLITQARLAREEKRKIKESRPEFKFSQTYAISPQQAIAGLGADIYELRDPVGKVIGRKWSAGTPYEGAEGITDPSKVQGSYWHAPGNVYRATKARVSQQTKTTTGGQSVGAERLVADPSGDLLNIGGQQLPLKEVEAMRQRADSLYKQAAEVYRKASPAKREEVLANIINDLEERGFDPAGINQYLPQQ